jgi:hypothetical protein
VLGVLASFTFAAGVADAAGHPARFGQTFQLAATFGEGGHDWLPAEKIIAATARDRDVTAVNDSLVAVAEADHVAVTVFSYRPVGGSLPVVLTSGRLPGSAGDVVLGATTAHKLRLRVGSTVRLTGTTGPHDLKVSGIGFVPDDAHNDYDEGAWADESGFHALFGTDYKYHRAFVALRPGVDHEATLGRLVTAVKAIDKRAYFETAHPTGRLAEVQDIRILPLFLSGFLTLLAVVAVGHALATTVRRRGHEVAVMRALGMTRPQARLIVITQASLLAAIGLAFGVPTGIALGRTLWRVVADQTPLLYVPPVALWALLAIGPAAIVLANLLALRPGHLAARLRVGHILRAE